MKNKLQQLAPVLEGFNVRVKGGKVLTKPEYKDFVTVNPSYLHHHEEQEQYLQDARTQYNQAQTLCKMPRVMDFANKAQRSDLSQGTNYTRIESLFSGVMTYIDSAKQPPALWMYVPCDEEGNVLEEPECECLDGQEEYDCEKNNCSQTYYSERYQSALDRVIFEGWEYSIDEHRIVTLKSDSGIIWNHTISGEWSVKMTDACGHLISALEDAFIDVDHFVDLNKLK